jgi:hypothetical protein
MVMRVSRLLVVLVSVATVSSLAAGDVRLVAQAPAPQAAQPAGQAGMGDMMKMHEKMMAEMKAADARLDALVKTMNAAAGGDAKTTAIAAVVNELVAGHKRMHAHMNEMHQQMMAGRGMMMKH